jgi:hypothetical protein
VSVTSASQAIFQFTGLKTSLFSQTSRYVGIDTATFTTAAGQSVAYVRRRFIAQPSAFASLGQHTVAQGERLDNMSWSVLGDPLLYYRLCDANGAMRPEELEQTGRVVSIPLPQGVPGVTNA